MVSINCERQHAVALRTWIRPSCKIDLYRTINRIIRGIGAMNFKHLHYFWRVAKAGSVARASEQLHLTPQTISGQIGLLEDDLGTPLFAKSGRNLELTDAGRLYPRAHRMPGMEAR